MVTATDRVNRPDGRALHARPRRRRRSPVFDAPTPGGVVARYLALIFMLVVSVGPMLWQLSTSLKGQAEDVYGATPRLLPEHPTLENYLEVMRQVPVLDFAANSLLVAVMGVAGNVVFATLAGFALARLRFKGARLVLGLLMATLLLPGEAMIISQFQTVNSLGLTNTLLGVALPGLAGTVNILLMRNAFQAIPQEMDDAAILDGATAWQRLLHIGLPAVKGTMAIIAVMTFIGAWDDFLWPLLVLQDPGDLTLTVGLAYLDGHFAGNPRTIAAGLMISLIPILVLFVALQRYFFRGVQEGGVKG
ncbi:carbohydrate ABC transporter permease [Sphaerisporangium fuscum]|uniref:carbohydrate ABC transporter permease n=1 Tax=Sphaerisporangium fuscum TaxID=2835868 RepID=UPI001BDD9D56|nr:carbohydrate ABC transporter permease [Sphaerisporangium fuscum]